MKRMILLLLALTLAGASLGFTADDAKPAIQPKEKTELFNGKDLGNWTIFLKDAKAEPAKTFKVEGGVIKCSGDPFGYIRTKDAYTNYVLTVEWRYVTNGNTGVFVHASGPDKIFPRSLECQGQHGAQGDFVTFADIKFTDMKTRRKRAVPDNEKPIGEWNVYTIVCDGATVRSYVNGKQMNEATGLNVTSGQICLQSEGGSWECRKVTLAPLTAAPKAEKTPLTK